MEYTENVSNLATHDFSQKLTCICESNKTTMEVSIQLQDGF